MNRGICILIGAAWLALSLHAFAGDKKDSTAKSVDSGSFGVFVSGRRVATESFSIQQGADGSVATAEFKSDGAGGSQSVQSSELQLGPAGDIRKYEWKEVSPGKARATVTPNNEFLTERVFKSTQDKPEEVPFLLPASTSILDDYFFSHREILIWRFLATACKQESGQLKCPTNQKTQFGTLNPQQRSSQSVSLEFMGRDKAKVRGADQDMNRFTLHSEAGDWALWVDDQFKLQKILVASDNTEIVRD